MGSSSSTATNTTTDQCCEEVGRVNFEPSVLDWLKGTGGLIDPVRKDGCKDEDCVTALAPLVQALNRAFPDATSQEALVLELNKITGDFEDNEIPLSAIDFTPVAGDDIQNLNFAVVGTGTGLLGGSIPPQDLADALMPLMAASYNAMTPAQRRAWHIATKSPDGSGWTDATGRYGEDDGLSGTAGYTDI